LEKSFFCSGFFGFFGNLFLASGPGHPRSALPWIYPGFPQFPPLAPAYPLVFLHLRLHFRVSFPRHLEFFLPPAFEELQKRPCRLPQSGLTRVGLFFAHYCPQFAKFQALSLSGLLTYQKSPYYTR
jgi:hypothetical protein